MSERKTLSVSEAAKELGVSRQLVTRLIIDGKMPATKVYGLWRVRRTDVETALAAGLEVEA